MQNKSSPENQNTIMRFLLLTFLFSFLFSFSQNIVLGENSKISLLTCGKGEELYTTFGHTAIRITDQQNQLDVVFNYGQFDFREGNFYLKFIKGNLQYQIGVASFEDFIAEYQYDRRQVVEQILNFSTSQKQELLDALVASKFSPSENHYTYKFIDRNCTTMVVDKLNLVLKKPLIFKTDNKSISYREVLYPKFENYFWYKLGINIIFGTKVDEKAEQLFLPYELENSLDKLKVNGKKLVAKKQILVVSNQPQHQFSFFDSIYFISLLLAILLVLNKKISTNIYLFVSGCLGLFLVLVGLYSLHKELLWNYNALLFNPLFVFLPFIRNTNALKKIGTLSLLLLLFYLIFMLNKSHLFLMIPFIIAHFVILFKISKLQKHLGIRKM